MVKSIINWCYNLDYNIYLPTDLIDWTNKDTYIYIRSKQEYVYVKKTGNVARFAAYPHFKGFFAFWR